MRERGERAYASKTGASGLVKPPAAEDFALIEGCEGREERARKVRLHVVAPRALHPLCQLGPTIRRRCDVPRR